MAVACARATSGVLACAIAEAAACRGKDVSCRDAAPKKHSSLCFDQAIMLKSPSCVYRLRKRA